MLPLAGRRLWLPDPLPPELCVALRGGLLSPPPPGKLVHLFFAAAACKGCPATGGRGGGLRVEPTVWVLVSPLTAAGPHVPGSVGRVAPSPAQAPGFIELRSAPGPTLGVPSAPLPTPARERPPPCCPSVSAHGGHTPSWSRWVTVRPPAADVDECAAETPPCGDGQYCENSRGAFTCEGAETPPPAVFPLLLQMKGGSTRCRHWLKETQKIQLS